MQPKHPSAETSSGQTSFTRDQFVPSVSIRLWCGFYMQQHLLL